MKKISLEETFFVNKYRPEFSVLKPQYELVFYEKGLWAVRRKITKKYHDIIKSVAPHTSKEE